MEPNGNGENSKVASDSDNEFKDCEEGDEFKDA